MLLKATLKLAMSSCLFIFSTSACKIDYVSYICTKSDWTSTNVSARRAPSDYKSFCCLIAMFLNAPLDICSLLNKKAQPACGFLPSSISRYINYRKGPQNRSWVWVWQLKSSKLLLHGGRRVRLAMVPSGGRRLTFDIKRHPFSPPPSFLNNTHSQFSKIKHSLGL